MIEEKGWIALPYGYKNLHFLHVLESSFSHSSHLFPSNTDTPEVFLPAMFQFQPAFDKSAYDERKAREKAKDKRAKDNKTARGTSFKSNKHPEYVLDLTKEGEMSSGQLESIRKQAGFLLPPGKSATLIPHR